MKRMFLSAAVLFCFAVSSFAADPVPIKLLPPDVKGGKPLMQCLAERRTNRAISPKKLPDNIVSNLLWAAAGINRPENGKRTAPSAVNWQEIDIYVAMEEGLYVYNAKTHALDPVLKSDLRKSTTTFIQPSRSAVAGAPLQLIYVADHSKVSFGVSDDDRKLYTAADTGFIAQNVYLYCASAGLASVVRGLVDRKALASDMKLRDEQHVILVQAVGYPQ